MSDLPLTYLADFPATLHRMLQDSKGYILLSSTSSSSFWFSPVCPPAVRQYPALASAMHALHQAVQHQTERITTSGGDTQDPIGAWVRLTDIFDLQGSLVAQVEVIGESYWVLWLSYLSPDLSQLPDLPDQQEQYKEILQVAQLGSWTWHIPTGQMQWDESANQLLSYPGQTIRQLTDRLFLEMMHPVDQEAHEAALARHQADYTQSYYAEFRLRHARGHYIWVANHGKVLRWQADGSPEWMIGAFQDITLRKLAEAQNRSSSTRLDLAMQAAGLSVVEYWVDENKMRFDASLSVCLGMGSKLLPLEMSWDEWIEHVQPSDRSTFERAVQQAKRQPGKSIRCQFTMSAEGTIHYFEWRGTAYTMGLHRQRCIVGVIRDLSDQIRQEKEMEWAHTMLQETNRMARVGGWELDLVEQKLRWTDITADIHEVPEGFKPSLDSALRFYAPGNSQAAIRQAIDEAIHLARPFDLELQILTFRGNPLWVRAQGKPIVQQGSVVKVIGAFQDIDVQHKAQEIFLEQNRKLHYITTALEQSAVVSVTDSHGVIQRVNDSFCAISGFSREELLGQQHAILQSGIQEVGFWDAFWATLRAGKTWQGELCNENKAGLLYWMYVIVHPMFDRQGRIAQYLSIQFPISDRKEAEAKLKASEEAAQALATQYQHILSAKLIYVLKLDEAGTCSYRNSSYLNTWGDHALQLGASFFDQVDGEKANAVRTIIQRCFSEKDFHDHLILPVQTANSPIKFVKWEFRSMEGELGQRQLLVVGVDVSEMMGHISKSELLLRTTTDQNYRLKSFTYITSHNIRSHAANISSIVQLLSKEQDEAARETFLEMLIVATHQLNQTIEDVNHILTINEVSKQEFSPCALSVISSEVVQYLRGLIDSEGARVSLSIPSDATVFAVETYVRSIVFHLITNAIKYRDPARRLEINIAATQKEEKWVLTVQDNGLGVDLKRFGKKMFSMYKTFHGNEDARGFGLFLIRNQVEAMGGKIEVTSDLGKGSIFHVYFGKID